jgi:selT/selW/selH-like putative selenoprotein
VSLKESVERRLRIPTRIRLGMPGALDIFVDGQQIYSKKQTGRLPKVDEVIDLIRTRIGSDASTL